MGTHVTTRAGGLVATIGASLLRHGVCSGPARSSVPWRRRRGVSLRAMRFRVRDGRFARGQTPSGTEARGAREGRAARASRPRFDSGVKSWDGFGVSTYLLRCRDEEKEQDGVAHAPEVCSGPCETKREASGDEPDLTFELQTPNSSLRSVDFDSSKFRVNKHDSSCSTPLCPARRWHTLPSRQAGASCSAAQSSWISPRAWWT